MGAVGAGTVSQDRRWIRGRERDDGAGWGAVELYDAVRERGREQG